MKNIEIKRRCRKNFKFQNWLLNLGIAGQKPLRLVQEDIYFRVSRGRLKLRLEGKKSQLIFYERDNRSTGRASNYEIVPLSDSRQAKKVLTRSLDTIATVKKTRLVYFWKNVRLHVDSVKGLGRFLEIESVVSKKVPMKKAQENFDTAFKAIAQNTVEPVDCSYSDLILRAKKH